MTSFSPLPPVVSAEDDKLIMRGRIKNPGALVSCHQTLWNEDQESSRKRAIVQAMADGEAPYSPNKERLTGNAGRANINWGSMGDALYEGCSPYNTLEESLDIFGMLPTTHGDPNSRDLWSRIISEEHTRMVRNWPSFSSSWQQTVRLFVMEGISFAFFDDEVDWRWKVKGLQFLKFERETEADINKLDIITCEVRTAPHELFGKIQAESELPEDQHRYWNREAVIQAIKSACPQGLDTTDWEAMQRAWKDNDITYGVTGQKVRLVHGFVRELDGTVSHYIADLNNSSDASEFLYKCEGKFKAMDQLLTAYIYSVGTNGDFHSIRGLGYKLFPPVAGQNKLRNKFLDAACDEATPYLTASSEDAITDRSIRPMGPYMILDDGLQFSERKQQDFTKSLIPAIELMDGVLGNKAAGYAPVSSNNSRTQKTKYQVQTEGEQASTLSAAGFALFMGAWGRHYKNIVRRSINPEYQSADPGGAEVWEFRRRCVARGVPLAAIYAVDVDAIVVNYGVGKGSITERRSALGVLRDTLYPSLDQKGRQILDFATAAAYAGPELARQLVPDVPGQRPPVDAQIAQMENNLMAVGQPPAFEVNQNHVVHVEKHLERLYEANKVLTETPTEEGLKTFITTMQPIWMHAVNDHLPLISPLAPEQPQFKEALQQLGETITNGAKHLDAEAARAQKEANPLPEGEEQISGGLLRSAADANARSRMSDDMLLEEQRVKLQAQQQKVRQDAVKGDLETAIKAAELAEKLKKVRQPEPVTKAA